MWVYREAISQWKLHMWVFAGHKQKSETIHNCVAW